MLMEFGNRTKIPVELVTEKERSRDGREIEMVYNYSMCVCVGGKSVLRTVRLNNIK